MKKIALVLAVLLVIGGTAFAEVTVGGEATVAGSVSTTIGMDLQSGAWGADADSSVTLIVPFANGSAGASGDDDLYGEISVSDIGVNWDADEFEDADNDGTDYTGSISAKIVAGDIYVGLNWGGYNNNYAAGSGDYDVNLDDDWYGIPAYGDLAFGYNNGMFGIEVEVAPKSGLTRAADATANEDFAGPWDGETAEADATATTQAVNGFVFSLDVEYTSEMITFPVYVTFDPAYDTMPDYAWNEIDTKILAVSVNPSVTAGPVTLTVPADFVALLSDENDMGYDLAPTLTFAVMDGLSISADSYIYNHVDVWGYGDVGFCVSADGLVSGLTASVDVDLTSVNKDLGWGVDVSLGYALADGLSVNVAPGFDSTNDIDIAGSLVLGSAFTGIDNTTVTLDYANGCYDLDGVNGSDAGVLSLVTKVAF